LLSSPPSSANPARLFLNTYIVTEAAENGWALDPVEGLTAAKYHAAERAKETGHVVVVRDVATGLEVARFPLGKSSMPAPDGPATRRPLSDSEPLVRLRAANHRLQAIVQSQSRVKKDPR